MPHGATIDSLSKIRGQFVAGVTSMPSSRPCWMLQKRRTSNARSASMTFHPPSESWHHAATKSKQVQTSPLVLTCFACVLGSAFIWFYEGNHILVFCQDLMTIWSPDCSLCEEPCWLLALIYSASAALEPSSGLC